MPPDTQIGTRASLTGAVCASYMLTRRVLYTSNKPLDQEDPSFLFLPPPTRGAGCSGTLSAGSSSLLFPTAPPWRQGQTLPYHAIYPHATAYPKHVSQRRADLEPRLLCRALGRSLRFCPQSRCFLRRVCGRVLRCPPPRRRLGRCAVLLLPAGSACTVTTRALPWLPEQPTGMRYAVSNLLPLC